MNSNELLAVFEKWVSKESSLQIMSDLCRVIGGCTIYIPTKPPRQEIDDTLTAKEIAARHDVCLKTAYRWRAQAHRTKPKTFSG